MVSAQKTEKKMLSGEGFGSTVEWDFFCSDGRNSNQWSKINVPSNWELEGFGTYTYGRWYKQAGVKNPSMEYGIYKYDFTVPEDWKGKSVSIIFEGAMTDTEVKINEKLAGDIHQGGFYRFSYDISDKLIYGQQNTLEAKVNKHSADKTVNRAERRADWWLFGGIYRPVYLEAKPMKHIETVAVDAKADGVLKSEVFFSAADLKNNLLKITLLDLSDNELGSNEFKLVDSKKQNVEQRFDNIKTWTCETPNLYQLRFDLLDKNKKTIHSYNQRIGFRTVEFKKHDGIYVNGTKLVLKGINRHSFWPDGGRTTNREISLNDALLIKQMNMNAVRFHYPPDTHFLEMCDSLGIFVVDELAGWQNSYSTEVGEKLLVDMLKRDVNHPSIIIWSNGNEGGWNTNLDKLFAEHDPQKRHVIHPWADFDGLDTHHYPEYQTGIARFYNGYNVFMPTEFMHGMYDQGHGAGLEDFWNKYTESPFFAGGFMWDFSDNAVRRSDKGDVLDSDGSLAADGILGPYREKEGSFYTVREVWSPIQVKPVFVTPTYDGTLFISNQYLFKTTEGAYIEYNIIKINSPINGNASSKLIYSGKALLPVMERGETRRMKIDFPTSCQDGDVLEIKIFDADKTELCTRTFPVKLAKKYFATQTDSHSKAKASYSIEGDILTLSSKDVKVKFGLSDGLIKEIVGKGKVVPLNNGPVAIGLNTSFREYKVRQDGNDAVFTVRYNGMVDSIQWRLNSAGLLNMSAVMLTRAGGGGGFDDALAEGGITNLGFTFDYPEKEVSGIQWFGRGPYRVWKNRIPGTNYNLWEKEYNNTITGEPDGLSLVYPEFKGYHANMYWCKFQSDKTPFTVYSESDGVYLRVFTPEEPKGRAGNGNTMPVFPKGDISFLYEIPAIRDFKPVSQHGPKSQPSSIRIKKGDEGIKMLINFDFR